MPVDRMIRANSYLNIRLDDWIDTTDDKELQTSLEPSPAVVEAEVTVEEEEEEEASTASEEVEEEKPIEGKEVEAAIEEG